MEHVAALLLIIGCSGDLKQCNELPAPVTMFETYEDCTGAMSPSLSDLRGSSEKILAQCVYVDPAMEEDDAELVWDVRADGRLYASIEAVDTVIAMDSLQQKPNAQSAQ